jgi:phosphatidylglycerol:prolipoprotein diacylglycerol transferase
LLAVAVWVGHRVFRRRLSRAGLDGVTGDRLLFWILVSGFLGAHLVDRLVYFPRDTLADPITLLMVWQGISSFGGFLGAITAAVILANSRALRGRAWEYLDAVAYAFPFGWIFGRLGCFVAFDHPGAPTHFFLGEATKQGVVIHNLGLEEAIYTVFVALVFALLGRRPRFPGFFVGLLPVLYSPFRFALDYLRARDVRYAGLTPAQYGAVALLAVGALILGLCRARAAARPAAA